MKKFKNVRDCLKLIQDIRPMHTAILELDGMMTWPKRNIRGNLYQLEYDEDSYAVIKLVRGDIVGEDDHLDFNTWLINEYDVNHVILFGLLMTRYGRRLEVADMDIYDYVHTLLDLSSFIKNCKTNNKDVIDMYNCGVPLVNETMNILNNIDYKTLVDRISRLGYITLYRSVENSDIDCDICDDGILFRSDINNISLVATPQVFRPNDVTSYTVDGKPKSYIFKKVSNNSVNITPSSNSLARDLIDIFSAIHSLLSKPYLFKGKQHDKK